MRKFAAYIVLSMLMLAGTGIAYYVELDDLNLPGFLSIVVELLVVVCVFGWLPMLIVAIVVLRRQSRNSAPK